MAVMRTSVSMLAYYDPDAEDMSEPAQQRKVCRLLGQIAAILAAFLRIHDGRLPIRPRQGDDNAVNFLWMLTGEDPAPTAVKALDQYLLLLAEHEMNASTFTAHVTASTESDLHSAITSALGTLKGPLHGRAVQEAMEQFLEIGTVENVSIHRKLTALSSPWRGRMGSRPSRNKQKPPGWAAIWPSRRQTLRCSRARHPPRPVAR